MGYKILDKKSKEGYCRYTLASDNFKVNDNNNNKYIKNIQEGSPKNPLIVLGMNPSIANEMISDPTTDRINEFVDLHDEYDGWIMVNIFTFVESSSNSLSGNVLINLLNNSISIKEINEINQTNILIIQELMTRFNNINILPAFGDIVLKDTFIGYLFINLYDNLNDNNEININWCLLKKDEKYVLTGNDMPKHFSKRSNIYKIDIYNSEVVILDDKGELERLSIRKIRNKVNKELH